MKCKIHGESEFFDYTLNGMRFYGCKQCALDKGTPIDDVNNHINFEMAKELDEKNNKKT